MRRLAAVLATAAIALTAVPAGATSVQEETPGYICFGYRSLGVPTYCVRF